MGMEKQETVKQICIHKSGWECHKHKWEDKKDWTIEGMKEFHMKVRKFSDIAYHYIIQRDGTLVVGRDIKYMPASATGHNKEVAAICLIGEFTVEEPSDAQINTLKILLLKLCKEYNIDTDMHHIFCHCDYRDPPGNRYCPGKNLHRRVPELCNWVREALKKGVK